MSDPTPPGGGDEGADDEEAEDVSSVTALVLVSDLLPLAAAAAFLHSISESWGEIQLQLLFRMKPALILVFFSFFKQLE